MKVLCCGCKIRFNKESSIKLNAGWFHSIECATEYGRAKAEKGRQKAIRKQGETEKKKHIQRKKAVSLDNVRHQHKLTQKRFNRMRVLQELEWFESRGLPPRCISCHGLLGGDQWCCGHFKTTHNSLLRYDEKNTYLQHNHRCNMNLSGDIEGTNNTMGYKKGLITRFGKEKGMDIIEYCETSTAIKRWTGHELSEMRAKFSSEIRRLNDSIQTSN